MIRLIVTPARGGYWTAALEDGSAVVVSPTPMADASRELIARGFDPATLVTMRHAGKSFDSFVPAPLKTWAAQAERAAPSVTPAPRSRRLRKAAD
jgi:hypothetical protein